MTSRDEGAVKALLSEGADVNVRNNSGQTPLILAIVSGQDHLLTLLLEAGADPSLRDHTQLNAVDWAERKGRGDLTQLLARTTQSSNSSTRNLNEKLFEAEKKTPPSLDEQRHGRSLSSDEKSRQWLAGIKRRLDEKAAKETTKSQSVPSQSNQSNIVRSGGTLPAIPDQVTPEISEAPPIIDEVTSENNKAGFITDQVTPEISKAPPIIDEVIAENNKAGFITDQVTPEISKAPFLTHDAIPEIFPQTTAGISPATARGIPLASTLPSKPSSSRKRCPKCNTFYNNELLAYCAYHIVPLVDADAPIVTPNAKRPSPLLWILVLITLSLSIVVGMFLSGYLYQNNDRLDSLAPAVTTTRQGIPVLGNTLVRKAVTLPAAEITPRTLQQTATITVSVKIDKRGRVVSASSPEGDRLLLEAAIEAAKRSTFSVEKLRGRGTEGTITYTFSR
ncbi:MAG TPA: ankyrin repeat domain-containing protein [Pyrinomonadaceae bacterium]